MHVRKGDKRKGKDMVFAVIDTNVLVSALLSHHSDSATVQVVAAISAEGICPLYNKEIMKEYKDVLNRSKFSFPPKSIASIISKIKEVGHKASRAHSDEFFPDAKDIVFYEVALSKEDAYLVTGNTKHFPKAPIVVTPTEMMQILERQRQGQ